MHRALTTHFYETKATGHKVSGNYQNNFSGWHQNCTVTNKHINWLEISIKKYQSWTTPLKIDNYYLQLFYPMTTQSLHILLYSLWKSLQNRPHTNSKVCLPKYKKSKLLHIHYQNIVKWNQKSMPKKLQELWKHES